MSHMHCIINESTLKVDLLREIVKSSREFSTSFIDKRLILKLYNSSMAIENPNFCSNMNRNLILQTRTLRCAYLETLFRFTETDLF